MKGGARRAEQGGEGRARRKGKEERQEGRA